MLHDFDPNEISAEDLEFIQRWEKIGGDAKESDADTDYLKRIAEEMEPVEYDGPPIEAETEVRESQNNNDADVPTSDLEAKDFKNGESDGNQMPESEAQEMQQEPQEGGSEPDSEAEGEGIESETDFRYDDLPDAPQGCKNHCEDTEEEETGDECPHCRERIKREREQWGTIATDMHGHDVLPGDKLRVVVPISFMQQGVVLTANVPNAALDRIAISTAGVEHGDLCWLSGKAISQFTGFHMKDDGPIWTFKVGKHITFAEKIGEIRPSDSDPNSEIDLGQDEEMDIEDQIQDFLDQIPETGDDEDQKREDEDQEDDEHERDDKEQRHREPDKLTKTQLNRIENIAERIHKKAEATFGNTIEEKIQGDLKTDGKIAARDLKIISRGLEFHITITALRAK
jgi:hypothetical protein